VNEVVVETGLDGELGDLGYLRETVVLGEHADPETVGEVEVAVGQVELTAVFFDVLEEEKVGDA